MERIQKGRKDIWGKYWNGLKELEEQNKIRLPNVPDYATNNAHMFYMVCESLEQRSKLIKKLKDNEVMAVFHYLSLHKSPYYHDKHDGRELPQSDRYTDCLVRLPMYYDLGLDTVHYISKLIQQ